MKLPEKAILTFPVDLLAQGDIEDLPPLEQTPTTVGLLVRVATMGERAHKGWCLVPEQLGDGWKSMANAFVNMSHRPGELYGSVRGVAQKDGALFATLALSRAKLKAENMDPTRLKTDFAVSAEWMYEIAKTYVMQGDVRLTLEEANEKGLLALNTTPSGAVELVMVGEDATMYPGGTSFGDIAMVPLTTARPAFPSAEVLVATAAGLKLSFSDSLDAKISRVQDAVRIKFTTRASDGEIVRPWILATFKSSVVFETERYDELAGVFVKKLWICDYTDKDGVVEVTDIQEGSLDTDYTAFAAAAYAHLVSVTADSGMNVADIDSTPAVLAGQNADRDSGSSNEREEVNNEMGTDPSVKTHFLRDEVEAMLLRERDATRAQVLAEVQKDGSDFQKSVVADYETKILPLKIQEAQAAERKKLEERATAIAELNKIKPLTDEERVSVEASMEKGEFDLRLAVALRENAVLKEGTAANAGQEDTPESRVAAAAAAMNKGGSGNGTVTATAEEKKDGQETPAALAAHNTVPLLVG